MRQKWNGKIFFLKLKKRRVFCFFGVLFLITIGLNYTTQSSTGISFLKDESECFNDSIFSGWKVEFFPNRTLEGLPILVKNLETNLTGGFDFFPDVAIYPTCVPVDNFSARFTRTILIDQTGFYRIELASDDGSRIFVDGGSDVFENQFWNEHPFIRKTSDLLLTKGQHTIVVDYFEAVGSAACQLTLIQLCDTVVQTEIHVTSDIPGRIYINGKFSGHTTPSRFTLNQCEEIKIRVATENNFYKEKIVKLSSDLGIVHFENNDYLTPKQWKILLIAVRKFEVAPNQIAVLTDQDIENAKKCLEATNTRWLKPFSFNLASWEIDSLIEETIVGHFILEI